jgi:PAS domain S-box-containing protein
MHLVIIVLVALLPALVVGTAGAWLAMSSFQRAYEDRLRDTARGVALVIDREIANHVSTLSALAASPSLDVGTDGDLSAFYAHARRAAKVVGSPVSLVGPDLRIRIDTDYPLGISLPATAAAAATRAALETGRSSVSNLLTAALSGHPVVIISVPVLQDGRSIAVISTRIEPRYLSSLLAAADLSGGTIATIADSQNIIVARSREAEPYIGREAPAWYAEAIAGQVNGTASGRILTGEEAKLAFQRVPGASGWTLMVLEPVDAYYASWRQTSLTLVLGGAAALAVALIFAMWLGSRVLNPIAVLKQQAEVVGMGGGSALKAFSRVSRRMGVTEFEALHEAIGRAGAIMAASERRHRALVETGAEALWRADLKGGLLESRGWEILTGQRPEELRGRGWLRALHPDDIGPTLMAWRKARDGRRAIGAEYRVRTQDGQWLWHRIRGVRVTGDSGEAEEWYGVVANIHDRKIAEAALAASEVRMRALVNTAPDAIVVMDVQGVVRSFNQGAERIFGHAAADVIGQRISMLMPAPDAERHDGYIAHYLHTGERHVIGTVTKIIGLREDGSLVPLEASIGEWQDAEGVKFFTGVLRDVTERRAAEERQALLAREVDHRAKNVLGVVQSLLRLTSATDVRTFAAAVEARVAALARVHSLLAHEGWASADLRIVAERELAAHARQHEQEAAITLAGAPCRLASGAVQPIAMVLHELATNASKHGALSTLGGKVSLVWRLDTRAGLLCLQWVESGGPGVTPPTRRGFGSRIIETTIRSQLGGTVAWHWDVTGLVCDVSVPLARVTANGILLAA